jgi:hypothetical protein
VEEIAQEYLILLAHSAGFMHLYPDEARVAD